ncbi:MAG: CpsD/CapB family tyrosine-protein kinase [Oscillospiraceae bacterium]|nr:CpsD/CapB family tyrosine-protein kinase [Oscillospiraceae bacterium]
MARILRRKKAEEKSKKHRTIQQKLSASSPFAVKEAYNAIRTKLLFTGRGEKCPVFAVTSSLAENGKTTNSVNLAVSIAMANQRVLLIDADMRKPSIHRYFNLDYRQGLSDVLAGLSTEIPLHKTDLKNLSVLTAGQISPNPAELLGSAQMDALLAYVRDYFDYIIIDTPPVNIITDACTLAEKITGYIFIVHSGRNRLRDINDAVRTLQEMNGNIVGFVLNDPSGTSQAHYSYRYSKYYRYSRYRYYGESNTE